MARGRSDCSSCPRKAGVALNGRGYCSQCARRVLWEPVVLSIGPVPGETVEQFAGRLNGLQPLLKHLMLRRRHAGSYMSPLIFSVVQMKSP